MITARRSRSQRPRPDIMLLANGRYGSPEFGTLLGPLLRAAGVRPVHPGRGRRRRA